MADNIRATPRNEFLGLLADAMYGGLEYMKDPRRTQQMQGLAGLLESTGIPKTTERMAYGEDLTNIGRANVPLLKPETAEALMTVAPFAPVAGRVAGRMIKATEGMPVGMGIKSVGDDIFNLSKQEFLGKPRITKNANAADLKPIELTTLKDVEPQPFMGGKYQIKMNEDGAVVLDKGKPIASYNFGDTLVVDKPYRKSGLAQELVYEWRTSFPAPAVAEERTKASQAIQEKVWERIQNEKRSLPEQSPYPQQAALDLAQQRAALPVEQGGLGLPANNTPEMRYQAMKGVEGNFVHGSKNPDIEKFKTRKQIFEESANDPNRAIAENHYANERNAVFASSDPEFTTAFSQHGYTDVGQAPTSYPLRMIGGNKVFDFENPSHLDMLKQKYSEMFPVKTIGREGYVPSEESIRMHTINKRIENLPNDTNNWPAIESQDFQKAIRELGFDAFHVNERGTKNIGVYDPSSLRSRFAAFDPFRKDVATATAMGVALPDLLAAEPTPKEKRRQSSGLLSP